MVELGAGPDQDRASVDGQSPARPVTPAEHTTALFTVRRSLLVPKFIHISTRSFVRSFVRPRLPSIHPHSHNFTCTDANAILYVLRVSTQYRRSTVGFYVLLVLKMCRKAEDKTKRL